MKSPGWVIVLAWVALSSISATYSQDYDDDNPEPKLPKEADTCNGVFLTYNFEGREKEYPRVKNVTAQSWSFKSTLAVINTGVDEVKAWKAFIGFHHNELLVSANGAVLMGGDDLPAIVGKNGTTIMGYPQSDLKTSIETAGDMTQIQAKVEFVGTQFGLGAKAVPMPKTIRLENDGFKCPAAKKRGTNYMYVCCSKNKKFKLKKTKTKFLPRQHGDLSFTYDVIQAYSGSYLAQVTIDNNGALSRLDRWNLTWEWMRGEFIYSMHGAYTYMKDYADCLYGPAGQYYQSLDFSQVMNCEKKPVITDLPTDRFNDSKVGRIPFCCRGGILLPKQMDESKARSMFQMEVYKMPPDMNRTALSPPQNWKITGLLNPTYKCGAPIRVESTEFPDPNGLDAITTAIATWQVTCNMTKPKPKEAKCCVSFSAYYNDSAIPCNTCACGCEDDQKCNPNSRAMLLPPNALLVPFANRTMKARAWARHKHMTIPKRMPCPDNCGVSINWHINSDYADGWSARMTLFNWDETPFEEWSAALQFKKAGPGYENVYSFNGTKLTRPNNTILFQGLPGLNYLMGLVNGTHPLTDPKVPGKQQSVISFKKKNTRGINIKRGDGFPTKVFFNGAECALPTTFPSNDAMTVWYPIHFLAAVLVGIASYVLTSDPFIEENLISFFPFIVVGVMLIKL